MQILENKKDDLYCTLKSSNVNSSTGEENRPSKFPSLPQIAASKQRGKRRMDCSAFEEVNSINISHGLT